MSKPTLTVERQLVWIDVQYDSYGHDAARLMQDFLRWSLDNDIFAKGGQRGPLGFSGSYTPDDAQKLLDWLKEQGIE